MRSRHVRRLGSLALASLLLTSATVALAPPAAADPPCLIFVHGKRDGATGPDYAGALEYWTFGSTDFIETATGGFVTPRYVVAYHGDKPYWDVEAARSVANQIAAAGLGWPDAGGNSCTPFDQGGQFWVVSHSMGGPVMDYILGNADPSDANYHQAFDAAADLISLSVSVSGAHRGSELADAVCGGGGFFCNLAASIFQGCGDANFWLRTDASVQVASLAGPPAKSVYLTGGYEAIFGASVCLSGEDDGAVQHASQYACGGSPTASFNNGNVCGSAAKQEIAGFLNLDSSHENHFDTKADSDRDQRRAIPDGYWECSGSPCAPNSVVQSSMSTAQLVETLVATGFQAGVGPSCGFGPELVLVLPALFGLHRRRLS